MKRNIFKIAKEEMEKVTGKKGHYCYELSASEIMLLLEESKKSLYNNAETILIAFYLGKHRGRLQEKHHNRRYLSL